MFIETENFDLINANEISRITARMEECRPGFPYWRWYAITKTGAEHPIHEAEKNRIRTAGSLLPARAGDTAVVVSVMPGEGPSVEEVPIVGWLVDFQRENFEVRYGQPILGIELGEHQRAGVLLPKGEVFCPGSGNRYPSRDDFAAGKFLELTPLSIKEEAFA